MLNRMAQSVLRVPGLKRLIRGTVQAVGLDYTRLAYRLQAWEKWFRRIAGRENGPLRVNVGGGHFFKPGWKVLDYPFSKYDFVPGAVDYPFDLAAGAPLPFADGSVEFIYTSHTLEHLPEAAVYRFLEESNRVLAPGGGIRITVPDFDAGYAALKRRDADYFAFATVFDTLEANQKLALLRTVVTNGAIAVDKRRLITGQSTNNVSLISQHYTQTSTSKPVDINVEAHVNALPRRMAGSPLTPGNTGGPGGKPDGEEASAAQNSESNQKVLAQKGRKVKEEG